MFVFSNVYVCLICGIMVWCTQATINAFYRNGAKCVGNVFKETSYSLEKLLS